MKVCFNSAMFQNISVRPQLCPNCSSNALSGTVQFRCGSSRSNQPLRFSCLAVACLWAIYHNVIFRWKPLFFPPDGRLDDLHWWPRRHVVGFRAHRSLRSCPRLCRQVFQVVQSVSTEPVLRDWCKRTVQSIDCVVSKSERTCHNWCTRKNEDTLISFLAF